METDEDIEIGRLVKENLLRYQAPSELRRRIRQDIRKNGPISRHGRLLAWIRSMPAQWASLASGLAAGVLITSISMHLYFSPAEDALAEELVASHVRSLMADHLSDVVSSDQHTVKPWFSGKLDYAPPVQDFADRGFALAGGRIDYVDHRAVAALVYRHKEHVINAFVWPGAQKNSGVRRHSRRGFNIIEWNADGMRYWAVSDVSLDDLEAFASLARSPLTAAGARTR